MTDSDKQALWEENEDMDEDFSDALKSLGQHLQDGGIEDDVEEDLGMSPVHLGMSPVYHEEEEVVAPSSGNTAPLYVEDDYVEEDFSAVPTFEEEELVEESLSAVQAGIPTYEEEVIEEDLEMPSVAYYEEETVEEDLGMPPVAYHEEDAVEEDLGMSPPVYYEEEELVEEDLSLAPAYHQEAPDDALAVAEVTFDMLDHEETSEYHDVHEEEDAQPMDSSEDDVLGADDSFSMETLSHLLADIQAENQRINEMRQSVAKARELIKELAQSLQS